MKPFNNTVGFAAHFVGNILINKPVSNLPPPLSPPLPPLPEISTQWPDEKSQDKVFDLSVLPSAPRASEAPKVDRSRLPSKPPYTVYLGNLSYECSEDDIAEFFAKKKLQVSC